MSRVVWQKPVVLRLGDTPATTTNGNSRLTMIEWISIFGIVISTLSLGLNLYRMSQTRCP